LRQLPLDVIYKRENSRSRAEASARRFQFYDSSLRMHVKQSFKIIVARFGILWRSLRFPLPFVPRILSSCMRIHNFCIDQKIHRIIAAIDAEKKLATEKEFVP
jgi:hypothetical protein